MAEEEKCVWVPCEACGGLPRNHLVLEEHSECVTAPDDAVAAWDIYQVVRCRGCEQIKFRRYSMCSEARDWDTAEYEEYNIQVFPENASCKRVEVDCSAFPADVRKMYLETIQCFNAGANTLAGAGLRATVEAICRDRGATTGDLLQKINSLVSQGVLAQAQADFLHEGRYIGNVALHEMRTPAEQDIIDGLEIVETLLRTVYVLPTHAARLQQRRQSPPTPPSSPTTPP